MSDAKAEIRMATFNLGLLRLKCCCRTVKESPPFVEQRFPHICDALANCTAQIVAIQEIYEKDQVAALLAAVKHKYPHHARYDNQKFWQFHCGLLFLSEFPIEFSTIKKHTEAAAMEKRFGCKSCLVVHVYTDVGKLCLVNMHTTAGGGEDTESAGVDRVRESELEEAMELCEAGIQKGCKAMIVGDFNCGPEASAPNYKFMEEKGYIDLVKPFADQVGATWTPESVLNNLPIFADCPPQRIDHFFAHKDAGLIAKSAKKIFTEPVVRLSADGDMVPLSDHYGVEIVLSTGRM